MNAKFQGLAELYSETETKTTKIGMTPITRTGELTAKMNGETSTVKMAKTNVSEETAKMIETTTSQTKVKMQLAGLLNETKATMSGV